MLLFICTVRDGDYRWCAHNILLLVGLVTGNMLDSFGYSGLKMLLFFIKDDEDTLPNATFVLLIVIDCISYNK